MRILILILFSILTFACKEQPKVPTPNTNANTNSNLKGSSNQLPIFGYEIVNTYKHDSKAFTQGLVYYNDSLYESTGQYGRSSIRKVELESGKVLQKYDLANEVFAEGLTILNDQAYQISWQNGIAWRYDLKDFKMLKEFRYVGDGWGLTNDGQNLVMSDGTHVLRVVNPETFETVRTIPVFREGGQPLMKLNELEYVKGEIWANVWHSEDIGLPNRIARIDYQTGKLVGWIDLNGISPEDYERDSENTLNGIAYDEKTDRIFVTGKQWKRLFEIKLKN